MIIFTHIPKTAGTALIDVFKKDGKSTLHMQVYPDRVDKLEEAQGKLGSLDMIHGHNGHGLHNLLGLTYNDVHYITILRDPYERAGSFYDFVRLHRKGHELYEPVKSCGSVAAMMELGIRQIDNCAVRMYCGETNASLYKEAEYGKITKRHFNSALNNLTKYYSAGIQEKLNDFVEFLIFKGLLNKNHLQKSNVTGMRTELTPEDRTAIEKYNEWDIELYEIIKEKWA